MKKGFKETVDSIFRKRSEWKTFTDEEKETNYFIFNRYMGKHKDSIKSALALSSKNIDKVLALDIWFDVGKLYSRQPEWFWKGSTRAEKPITKLESDYLDSIDLDEEDITLLKIMEQKNWEKSLKEFDKRRKK